VETFLTPIETDNSTGISQDDSRVDAGGGSKGSALVGGREPRKTHLSSRYTAQLRGPTLTTRTSREKRGWRPRSNTWKIEHRTGERREWGRGGVGKGKREK